MRHSMKQAREIAAQFPRLRDRLDTPAAGYGAALDNSFEFGLLAILNGLQPNSPSTTTNKTRAGQRRPSPWHDSATRCVSVY